jgi:hypothetical protein
MDMKQYAGSESKYLKVADLGGQKPKVVIESVELVEFPQDDGSKKVKPCLKFQGKEKRLVCNATAVQELGNAISWDSDAWPGTEVGLSSKHYAQLGVDGIVLTVLSKAADFVDDDIPF